MNRILRFSLLLVLFLGALPLNSAHADGPTPILDQEFVTPTNASIAFDALPLTYVAQTFTAGQTGLLDSVNIDVLPSIFVAELSLEIRGVTNGVPNDTVLLQRSISVDELQTM